MLKDALGGYRGSVGELSRIIGEHPDNAEAFYNRANAKSCSGDFDGAVMDFTMAIRLGLRFREMISAYGNRALARVETGDLQGAMADFTEIISKKPNNRRLLRTAYTGRALLKEKQGDTEGAAWDRKMAELCTPGIKQHETKE
jgi:tetratricopeptide (TPR) repeat protein